MSYIENTRVDSFLLIIRLNDSSLNSIYKGKVTIKNNCDGVHNECNKANIESQMINAEQNNSESNQFIVQ